MAANNLPSTALLRSVLNSVNKINVATAANFAESPVGATAEFSHSSVSDQSMSTYRIPKKIHTDKLDAIKNQSPLPFVPAGASWMISVYDAPALPGRPVATPTFSPQPDPADFCFSAASVPNDAVNLVNSNQPIPLKHAKAQALNSPDATMHCRPDLPQRQTSNRPEDVGRSVSPATLRLMLCAQSEMHSMKTLPSLLDIDTNKPTNFSYAKLNLPADRYSLEKRSPREPKTLSHNRPVTPRISCERFTSNKEKSLNPPATSSHWCDVHSGDKEEGSLVNWQTETSGRRKRKRAEVFACVPPDLSQLMPDQGVLKFLRQSITNFRRVWRHLYREEKHWNAYVYNFRHDVRSELLKMCLGYEKSVYDQLCSYFDNKLAMKIHTGVQKSSSRKKNFPRPPESYFYNCHNGFKADYKPDKHDIKVMREIDKLLSVNCQPINVKEGGVA